MATTTKAPAPSDTWRDKLAAASGRISRAGPPSDPDSKLDDGSIPPGGGSAPIPDDPATTDPLGHLDELPGVYEEPPTPGEGLSDAPPPVEPPVEPPPPPAARQASKGA